MRFYVASGFNNYYAVRAVIDNLQKLGHPTTFDWTRTPFFNEQGDPIGPSEEVLSVKTKVDYAFADLRGVMEADAVLLLWTKDMVGSLMEAGMGLAKSCPVYVIGSNRFTIFWSLPNVKLFDTLIDFYEYLDAHGA